MIGMLELLVIAETYISTLLFFNLRSLESLERSINQMKRKVFVCVWEAGGVGMEGLAKSTKSVYHNF